jgi:cytochrome c
MNNRAASAVCGEGCSAGRARGTEAGYDYSPALKAAAITWDEKELDKFLQNPGADVHGTKMVVSVPGNDDRQNVIAYLKTLKP